MAAEKRKKAWLAALLTFLIPGLGQAYAGRYDRGLVILAMTVLYAFFILQTLAIMEAFFLAEGETLLSWAKENFIRVGVSGLRLIWTIFLTVVLYAWVILDAYLSVANSRPKD